MQNGLAMIQYMYCMVKFRQTFPFGSLLSIRLLAELSTCAGVLVHTRYSLQAARQQKSNSIQVCLLKDS